MNEKTRITEQVRGKVHDIMQLAMLINDSPTEQELTGNKPTIFVEFSGHISKLGVHIAPEGWFDEIETKDVDFCEFNLTEDVNEKLDAMIKKLNAMLDSLEGGD